MTKTQTKLIETAKAHQGRVAVEMAWGRGSQGGKITSGIREWEAATALVEAGLLEVIARDRTTLAMGNGHTCWVSSRTLRLPTAA